MTVRLTHDVFCDGCGNWVHCFTSGAPMIRRARKMAQDSGFVYRHVKGEGYKDFCPKCAKSNLGLREK